jgi:hypothetical protein
MRASAPRFVLSLLLFTSLAFSRVAISQAGISMAPVPDDPLELVTENAQPVVDPGQRASILQLLERAQQNYNFYAPHAPAFTFKVSFTSSGQSQYEGSGSMEETWIHNGLERWTSQIAGTSQVRVINGGAWGNSATEPIPMRVQMVRDAILWPVQLIRPRAMIRSATASYNGVVLTCILGSGWVTDTPSPRKWVETEYCIDPLTGLLHLWSEAPGIYVTYDYSDAIQFHGHTVARQITVTEDGNPVLSIHVDSLEDAGQVDMRTFIPTPDMRAQGQAFLLAGPQRSPLTVSADAGATATMIQPIIVHATVNTDGQVVETEALQNSPQALTEKALELVRSHKFPPTNRQLEMFINVQFYVNQRNTDADSE